MEPGVSEAYEMQMRYHYSRGSAPLKHTCRPMQGHDTARPIIVKAYPYTDPREDNFNYSQYLWAQVQVNADVDRQRR